MDDDDLMGRISGNRPAIAPRTGPLMGALDAVVRDSGHRRRRKHFLFAGITLSLLLVGGTSAAIASPSLLSWLGFVPDNTLQHINADGDVCAAGIILRPEGVPADDASFVAARTILLDIDFDTLQIPDDIRTDTGYAEREEAKAESFADWNAAHPGATMRPAAADLRTDMLVDTAYRLLTAGVTDQGLDANHFSLEGAGSCDAVAP
jgi:hypothetical protein